jgi:hypothetical protein
MPSTTRVHALCTGGVEPEHRDGGRPAGRFNSLDQVDDVPLATGLGDDEHASEPRGQTRAAHQGRRPRGLAGPDEMWDGIGYKLALPEPRHDKLADFRVLLIDTHPLCPTAASIKEALDGLADRLAKLGCTVVRTSPGMPDLARTTRNYNEVLLALLGTDSIA